MDSISTGNEPAALSTRLVFWDLTSEPIPSVEIGGVAHLKTPFAPLLAFDCSSEHSNSSHDSLSYLPPQLHRKKINSRQEVKACDSKKSDSNDEPVFPSQPPTDDENYPGVQFQTKIASSLHTIPTFPPSFVHQAHVALSPSISSLHSLPLKTSQSLVLASHIPLRLRKFYVLEKHLPETHRAHSPILSRHPTEHTIKLEEHSNSNQCPPPPKLDTTLRKRKRSTAAPAPSRFSARLRGKNLNREVKQEPVDSPASVRVVLKIKRPQGLSTAADPERENDNGRVVRRPRLHSFHVPPSIPHAVVT